MDSDGLLSLLGLGEKEYLCPGPILASIMSTVISMGIKEGGLVENRDSGPLDRQHVMKVSCHNYRLIQELVIYDGKE